MYSTYTAGCCQQTNEINYCESQKINLKRTQYTGLKGPVVEELHINIFALACVDMFSCLERLGSVSIHIVADPGCQQCCADTCTCSALKVSHFRHVSARDTSVVLLSIANRENMICSSFLCMFFPCSFCLILSGYLNYLCCVSVFGVGSFNRLASFPLLCTAANRWHISSAWSKDFSLSPSRMTSSCVTSRQCVLSCVCFS